MNIYRAFVEPVMKGVDDNPAPVPELGMQFVIVAENSSKATKMMVEHFKSLAAHGTAILGVEVKEFNFMVGDTLGDPECGQPAVVVLK